MFFIYLYRVIIIAISLYFITTRSKAFFKKESGQTIYKLLITIFVWTGVSFVIIFSSKVSSFTREIGFGENFNTLIFMTFVVVFIIIFKLLSVIERIERSITDMVRKEALKDLKIKK